MSEANERQREKHFIPSSRAEGQWEKIVKASLNVQAFPQALHGRKRQGLITVITREKLPPWRGMGAENKQSGKEGSTQPRIVREKAEKRREIGKQVLCMETI